MSDNQKSDEKRKIVRNYIQTNSDCTYLDIRRDTRIKVERIYKNMKAAYEDAGVVFSKNLTRRNLMEQKRDVIIFIQSNPNCSVTDIQKKTRVNVGRAFGGVINAYKAAGIRYTEKQVTSGVMNPIVIKRCNDFERDIIKNLRDLGEVIPKVRTPAGIVDCIFIYQNKKYVVEIKDFRGKNNITMHELKQLIKYMKSLSHKNGIIVCPKDKFPKRNPCRNVYIDDMEITFLSEEDLRGRSIKDFR